MPSCVEFDFRFPKSARILCIGSSNTGKSVIIKRLLEHNDKVFQSSANLTWYFYAVWQPLYAEIEKNIKNVKFFHGLNLLEKMLSPSDFFTENRVCIVIDDLDFDVFNNLTVSKLFTLYAHHLPIHRILLTSQNPLGLKSKFGTTILRNCSAFILTRSPHMKHLIKLLGQQMCEGKKLLEIYNFSNE